MKVKIEKPTPQLLKELKTETWPRWTSPKSKFNWHYDEEETCHLRQGRVIVHTADGDFEIKAGDVVTFAAGLDCEWEVLEPVSKVYSFGLGRL